MKRLFITIILLSAALTLQARRLNLEDAIRIAQDSTIEAYRSQSAYEQSLWEHSQFLSSRKSQLSLILNPSYKKYTSEPLLHYYSISDYNMFNTYGELRFEHQATVIGGNYFISTGAMWTEFFGNQNASRIFSTIPVAAGYTNSLIGFNSHKWDKLKEDFKADYRKKLHQYELSSLASQAAELYLDCIVADSRNKISLKNREVASKMLNIAKEKFEIASISKDELLALELNFINASNNLVNAENNYNLAKAALVSYLKLNPDEELELETPINKSYKTIDLQEAIDLAIENNPVIRDSKMKVLEASAKEEKARIQASLLQTSIDVSLGIQSYNTALFMAYGNQTPFVNGGVTLKIPIFDSGLAKNRLKAAQVALNTERISEEDVTREIKLEVTKALRSFNMTQELTTKTVEAIAFADEAYALAEDLYSNGEININTFVLAQNRKDEAYSTWQNIVRNYWNSYYQLCRLCVYDF